MKRPTTDLDSYRTEDLEYQVRQMISLLSKEGVFRMVVYAWLSEERKRQNQEGKAWGWRYCPFEEDEKVSKTHGGLKLTGKIYAIDRDYYDGDCLVLYVDLDKRSSRKWAEKVAEARKAG